MVICGSYMFEFSVNKDMKERITMIKGELPAHPLAYFLTLLVKELEISVEQGKVVTTLHTIKH